MKKQTARITALLCIAISGTLHAVSQFRSPFSLERGQLHYPLVYPQQSWWYDRAVLYCERSDTASRIWDFDKYIGAYYRCANKAFANCADTSKINDCQDEDCDRSCDDVDCGPCCDSGSTTKTATLSQLWFGKQAFTAAEAFFGSVVPQPGGNPFLSFAKIVPRFSYVERGGYVGAHFEHRFRRNMHWAMGARVSLPFKLIEINQDFGCCDVLEEGLSDVVAERNFSLDADQTRNDITYAYRMDFLSTLIRAAIPSSDSRPIIQYGDGSVSNTTGPTLIAGVNVSGTTSVGLPVYVTRSVDGSIPDAPFERKAVQVTTALQANGAGGADDSTLFFNRNANYLGGLATDVSAQRQLFLVPRLDDSGTQLASEAVAIRSAIHAILDTLEFNNMNSAVEFLRENCIDLAINEYRAGLGDLRLEVYGQYEGNNWFTDLIIGLIFPTGKKVKDARRVFLMSTGNNGHYELLLGAEGGWRPRDWFAFEVYGMFSYVCKATETKAAPFTGATIKNIGPNIDAKVGWNEFEMRANFNFFHPCNTDLGCVLGYELFVKGSDNVSLCATTAKDLLGNVHTLDSCLLEARTKTITHKIEGEMFSRWDFCEIFMGASRIVAGKNAMQETAAYIGMAIYF